MKTITMSASKREKTFGQQERYEHVTKAIFNEKLKGKDGMWLRNVDITTEEPWLARKVRRIIEKRMCQTYHKQHKEFFHERGYLLSVEANLKQGKNTITIMNSGALNSYIDNITIEPADYEAEKFAIKLVHDRPWCHKSVNVYKCSHCNMYHIGHESEMTFNPILSIQPSV